MLISFNKWNKEPCTNFLFVPWGGPSLGDWVCFISGVTPPGGGIFDGASDTTTVNVVGT